MQLAFDNRPAVLVDDARGSIVYHPACIGADDAERWFANLRDTVAWQAERRRMYERDVDVPRLTAHFALAGDDANLPEPLAQAAAVAARVAGCSFNSVGLNFYRDGRDSVAAHNDRLHRLVAGAPIALLSLGAARRMLIRAKAPPRRTLQLDLEPGSVLLMSYASQHHFDHGIPKTRAAVGPRISLAFRCLVADATD
jgi:alkylated DNA repair dioxygenase AlkB